MDLSEVEEGLETDSRGRPHTRKYAERSKQWWSKGGTESKREYDRRRHLAIHYGITMEQFDVLFQSQGECCAICKSTDPYRNNGNWDIDHDHETGLVRGILCHHCNVMLGSAKENLEVLESAIVYLKYHRKGSGAETPGRG